MRTSSQSLSSAFTNGWILCLMMALAGCTATTPKQTVAAPPPPKPAVVQPPAPEQPLSVSQTAVVLPPEQPFNPDAIPSAPAPPAPVTEKPAAPAPTRSTRRSGMSTSAPKQEPAETEATVPPPPAVEAQPPIQPVLSGEEVRQINVAIESRRKEIEDRLNRAKSHPTSENQTLKERIDIFLNQTSVAEKRNDLTQADRLSQRALVLAQELEIE